jgi:hypothetical protein
MIARISTVLDFAEEDFWKKVIEPRSLQFVASPILSFRPTLTDEFDGEWVEGKTYDLRLYFLKIVPLGYHKIKLVKIDKQSNTIVSNESGTLAPVWNHTIWFRKVEQNKLLYMDEVEIKAGLLTPAIWIFACLFYRHRQKRWKILLKKERESAKIRSGLQS